MKDISFKQYLKIRTDIKNAKIKKIFKHSNLLKLMKNKYYIRNFYYSNCFYCKSIYVISHNNIFCSKTCKIMFTMFTNTKKKLEILKSHKFTK